MMQTLKPALISWRRSRKWPSPTKDLTAYAGNESLELLLLRVADDDDDDDEMMATRSANEV
jgi:hypothetical protein